MDIYDLSFLMLTLSSRFENTSEAGNVLARSDLILLPH